MDAYCPRQHVSIWVNSGGFCVELAPPHQFAHIAVVVGQLREVVVSVVINP